jgi:hypothetical protein
MQIKHLHMAEWWVYHPGELPVEDAEFLTLNGSAECHRQASHSRIQFWSNPMRRS